MKMGVFDKLVIALDIGYDLDFKKKSWLRKSIVENGGTISYIVNKKCNFVIISDPEKCSSSNKCRMATKYRIPVLSMDYIWNCIGSGELQLNDPYVVGGGCQLLDFKQGKISALKPTEKTKKTKFVFNPRSIKALSPGNTGLPPFDEDRCVVAKYAIYEGLISNQKIEKLFVIEIQALPSSPNKDEEKDQDSTTVTEGQYQYRVVQHTGPRASLETSNMEHQEIRPTQTADQALSVFAMLCEDLEKHPKVSKCTEPIRGVGSTQLQKLMVQTPNILETCNEDVKDLVEHIWSEAMSEITFWLGDITQIKVEEVEKAEAVLLKLRDALRDSAPIEDLVKTFYTTLPYKVKEPPSDKELRLWLGKQQDICQLIKDLISVNEMTNFEKRLYVEAKYAALRCGIKKSDKSEQIETLVQQSVCEGFELDVVNVYEVWRQTEDLNFRHDLENKQFLFHSSRVENFVGILSRGLLLPKIVVDDYGGKRSDVGLLGSGIYFASRASTSAKYSTPSKTKGTRLLLVNEVALGKCEPCYHHNLTLTSAPYPYNSTHGIGKEYDDTTAFIEDQYAIYDTTQQRLCYLVEFTLKGDRVKGLEVISEPPTDVAMEEDMDHADLNLNDVTDIDDPMSKVKPGLIGGGRGMVELIGVHIRAKIVDLATQVVVLQKYVNNGDSPIEAKYVFPLDDAGAVCGFEAFINGKHIVGEVKEKETAHKEYKKAISEGHGAYLMDQDEETPDVFTVSVGNLPPKASVLIKITYVAEVQVEGELISFRLPATVAPWKESSALKETTQEELSSHKVSRGQTSVQVAIEMPFDIKSLECPSHFVNIKQTASKAFVEMLDAEEFGTGFHLLIGLAEIHVPRMWVENLPDDPYRQACMLTFHPEFEASAMEEGEIILVLDCSNSMKGAALVEAKKVALLLLKEIPSQWSFNVLKFGSDFEELFPAPKVKTDQTVDKAWHFIQNAAATLGNTDASRPFHSFFLLPKTDDTLRNVFLVSDGHINNTDLLLRNGSKNATHTRVFTFGVSSTCNSYFLKALARVSGGAFEFFNKATKSKWEPKVKGQIQKASQPGLTSVSVEWVQYDDNLPALDQAPRQITALFNGFRQVVYGFVANCTMAKLTAKIGGQEVSTVVSTSELSITEGMIVHRLTARAMIRDWEDGMLSSDRTNHEVAKMDLKNYVIDLSTDYSIVTQFTSFIAVEKREENEKDETPSGPSMDELVEAEDVDMLDYMGWTKEPDASELPIHILMSEWWFKYRDLSVMETKFLALLDGQQVLNQEVIQEYAETLVRVCHLNEENQEELADKVCTEIDKKLPEMSSEMRLIMNQPVALDGGWGDDSDDDDDFYDDDDSDDDDDDDDLDEDDDEIEMEEEEDEDFGSCLFDDSSAERRRNDGDDEVVIQMGLMDSGDDMFHDLSYAISKPLGDSSGDDLSPDPPPPYRKSRRRRGAAAVQEPMMEALEESKFSSPTKFYNDADDNDADYGGDDDGDLDDDADEEYEEHEDLGYCLLDSISATATPQPAYAHATSAVEIHSDDTKTKSLSKAEGKKVKRDDESNFTLAHFKRKPKAKAIQTGAKALAKTKPTRVFYKADLIDNAMDDDEREAPDSPLERSACSFMVEDERNITTLDSRFTLSSELRQSRLFGNVLSVQEKDKKSLLPQISTQPVAGKRGGRSSSISAVTGKMPPPPPPQQQQQQQQRVHLAFSEPPPQSGDDLLGSAQPPPPPPPPSTGGLFGFGSLPPPPAPGLFGSAHPPPPPAPGLFGSAQPPPPPPTGGLFGSAHPPPPPAPGLFGSAQPPPPSTGGLFGSAQPPPPPSTGGLFGSAHPPAPSSSTGLFGSAQPPPPPSTGGLFGSAHPPPPPSTGGLFGSAQPPPPPSTGGLFGSAQPPPPPPSTGGLFGSAQPPPPAPGALFGSAQGFSFGGPSPRAQRFGSAQPQGFSLGGPMTRAQRFGSARPQGFSLGAPMTRAQRFGSPQVQGQDTFGSPIQPQHGIPLRHYMGGAPINPFASPLAAKAGGCFGSNQPQQDDLFGSSGALQANPFASPPRGGGGGRGGGGEGRELFRAKGKQSMEGKPFGTSTGPFVSSQQPLLSPEAERACRFDDEKKYSPTSPSYSPTSPSYSPTSPSLLMDSPLMPTGPAPPLQLCKAMPPPPPSQAPPPQKYIAPPLRQSMIQQAALSLPGDKLKSTKSSPMEKKVERDELRRQIAMAECRFTSREHLQLQQEQLKKIPLSKGQRRRSQESDRCLSSSLMSPDTSQTYDIQETVLELQPTSQALCSFSRPWLPLPSRKKKRSLKGMDRLTAADCEIEFEEDLSPLACFGIGSKLVCVRKGEQRLKLERLSRLLECQADTGYWELNPQLGDLIGIDSAACIKMLEDSGIKSLGRTAIIALQRLLATVLALISIIEIVFPEMIPISKSNILDRLKDDGDEYEPLTLQLSRLAEKGMSPEWEGPLDLVESVKKAYTFCTATDEEYPLAYSTLELGPDWLTVCASMLKVPVKH